jgi:Flp pilus assembly protein TadD
MEARRIVLAFAIMGRALLLLLISLLTAPAHAADTQWHRVKSRNFDVITNAGERAGRDTALEFEKMRNGFGLMFSKSTVNGPGPLQIFVLRTQDDVMTLLGSSGFQAGEDKNFIVLDLSNPGANGKIFHEYAHSVINSNFPPMQPWFDEGVAEFFSGMQFQQNATLAGGEPYPGAIAQLRASPLSLVQLFSVKRDSPEYKENDRRSPFYLQSWLMVHYIVQQKMMPQAGEYFGLVLNRKMPVEEAINQAFGVPVAKLEEQIKAHLNSIKPFSLPIPDGIDPSMYVVAKLKDPEAKVALAEVKLHTLGKEEEAVADLEAVQPLAPNYPDIYAALGRHYLRRNDFERAAVDLKRAVDLGSTDPRPYYFTAVLLTRESGGSKWLQIRSLLRKALELDQNHADALALLAFAEISGGDTTEAIRWIKQAIALSPRNDGYRLDLAKYMIADKRGDAAKALLAYLANSEDQKVANESSALLKEIETLGVDQYAAEKRRERENPMAHVDPRWRPKSGGGTIAELDQKKAVTDAKPDTRKVEFVKGRIVKVACSADTGATITLAAASGKTWTMKTQDREKLVLIGADKFSCGWSNVRVAVNYKNSGVNTGDMVSLELQ